MNRKWRLNGLEFITESILDILEPFSIFGAQLLWVAQPSLSLFMDGERITHWAESLEDPETFARWRDAITEDTTNE